MEWTDERITLLRELWGEGLSASQIADRLGDVTRNAVIGKAHRLGLEKRPSPIKRSPEGSPVRKAKTSKPKPKGATILDLTERMCRWPIGHPGERDFHFCGKKTVPGLPYCAEHASVAYQSPPSRRDEEERKNKSSANSQ